MGDALMLLMSCSWFLSFQNVVSIYFLKRILKYNLLCLQIPGERWIKYQQIGKPVTCHITTPFCANRSSILRNRLLPCPYIYTHKRNSIGLSSVNMWVDLMTEFSIVYSATLCRGQMGCQNFTRSCDLLWS